MEITEVRIKLVASEDGKMKAVANVTIDGCLAIHDVKIIDGKDGLFIAMPNKKLPNGEHKDIVHPINTEAREYLKTEILKAYNEALNA